MLLPSTDPRLYELQTKEAKLDVNSRRAPAAHCERSWASDGCKALQLRRLAVLLMPSFLENLPSRGTLTATVPGQSLYKAPQTYLAQHPTAPPEEQVITTDPENVLLRVLKLSQKREGPKGKGDKGKAAEKSKRPAAEAAEGAPVNKKQNSQAAAGDGEAGNSRGPKAEKFTLQELQGKTNKALMDLLKDKGQSTKGKKEDLVKRLMQLQKREAMASRPH